MVCVPCILLPIILAIYIKFIQPIIFRLLPESWRTAFDAVLYPTCPLRAAPSEPAAEKVGSTVDNQRNAQLVDCGGACDADTSKKDD